MDEILNDRLIVRLAKLYVRRVNETCDHWGVPYDDVFVSLPELSSALKEANRDLMMIRNRRAMGVPQSKFSGISLGKISGAICFRLNRYRILNIQAPVGGLPPRQPPSLKSQRKLYFIQDIAIIKFIFDDVLGINLAGITQKELLYIFSRRHMNQEMLGVVFDALAGRRSTDGPQPHAVQP